MIGMGVRGSTRGRTEVAWAIAGIAVLAAAGSVMAQESTEQEYFEGRYFAGRGDAAYLELLETARGLFDADPALQHVAMLYTPEWNGLLEGATWRGWWVQNSYGTTYCALPFLCEPYLTFLQNSQDLWFKHMGNGRRKGAYDWVAPDGSLCDVACPDRVVYKQGDGNRDIHDWGLEFTAAGLLMQAELLLIARDHEAAEAYLPKLERCAAFIESRRDPKTNLFLAGPAANLLAPSYAGWKKPDGAYGRAYLTGLSITYIGALERLAALEAFAGAGQKAAQYRAQAEAARKGLPALTTEEGYFIKSLDPDGVRHGVYGADRHGYFEAAPNHDAMALRVVDDAQAQQIYAKIASIEKLRRHGFIIANEPGLDDMYEPDTAWLWQHGTWVNGGHWSTCEGRMILGYYRVGAFEDARRSMLKLLSFAREFRMDNPLVEFGSKVYQPQEPINLCYDAFAPAAAFVRGLFEYRYGAKTLTLFPHIPPGIGYLAQRFPIRFGAKRVYLSTTGQGAVTAVRVDGATWQDFDGRSVTLHYDALEAEAHVELALGGASLASQPRKTKRLPASIPTHGSQFWNLADVLPQPGKNELPLRIGADANGEHCFVGDIGGVQVFNGVLSDDAIEALARNEVTLEAQQRLAADWLFDEPQNGVYLNVAGRGLDARPMGAVHDAPLWRRGLGWAEVDASPRLDLCEGFTIALWFAPSEFPEGGMRLIDKIPVGGSEGYMLDTHPGDGLRLITVEGALTYKALLQPEQWVHVTAVFEPGRAMLLYFDGGLVAARACKAPPRVQGFEAFGALYERLASMGLEDCYEARHAKLIVDYISTLRRRQRMMAEGRIPLLPDPSQAAAERAYTDTLVQLAQGLKDVLQSYADSKDPHHKRVHGLWREATRS